MLYFLPYNRKNVRYKRIISLRSHLLFIKHQSGEIQANISSHLAFSTCLAVTTPGRKGGAHVYHVSLLLRLIFRQKRKRILPRVPVRCVSKDWITWSVDKTQERNQRRDDLRDFKSVRLTLSVQAKATTRSIRRPCRRCPGRFEMFCVHATNVLRSKDLPLTTCTRREVRMVSSETDVACPRGAMPA